MKRYFEGWYYKHQGDGKTLAVIPGRANGGAFVQIVTEGLSHNIVYPLAAYRKMRDGLRVGGNAFTSAGLLLDIEDAGFSLSGHLRYGPLTPLHSDIMGPFRYFPMDCRHGVVSMRHTVSGRVKMNGEILDFTDGVGYIESDSGRSFPESYTWVQCNDFPGGESVMASAAKIPFLGRCFRGCIAALWLDGREHRLATYSGARIIRSNPGELVLRQRKYLLEIITNPGEGQPLAAPENGVMCRTIHESISCPARVRLIKGDCVLFEGISARASFEYVSTAKCCGNLRRTTS